jgi:hypothetical protein
MNTSGLKVTKMLAPYGQASFLKLITKVGVDPKFTAPARVDFQGPPTRYSEGVVALGRTVVRRKAAAQA